MPNLFHLVFLVGGVAVQIRLLLIIRQQTLAVLLPVRPITVPVTPRIVEVSVLRSIHTNTAIAHHLIAPIAFPTRPVRRIDKISVRRHHNGYARTVVRFIASITAPSGFKRRVGKISVCLLYTSDAADEL